MIEIKNSNIEQISRNYADSVHGWYLQPIVTQYLVCNKSEIWP